MRHAACEHRPSPPSRARAAPLALAAALALAAGCGGSEPARDVILVTIDTLRADRIGLHGYERPTTPEIDRWFGAGAIFTRAYSTEASTSPSVVSILSGKLPQEHRVRLFHQLVPDETKLLPDFLPRGYQTAAFVSNAVLTDEAIGFGSRFEHYDDFVDERESMRAVYERDAQRTTDAALRWLREHRDPARPLFLWLHYIDPHGPYRPPADWGVRFKSAETREIPIERVPFYTAEAGITDGFAYVDRYDSEVAYVDAQVGRLLDGYAELRNADEALVVLTADHGESMMEHESWFTHGYQVYDEIVRVPLLVRGPGVERGRFDLPVSGIDVAATILRFVGSDGVDELDGVDLRRGSALDPQRLVYAEASRKETQWRAVVQGTRKWIVAVQGERRPVAQQLFDLAGDPRELRGVPLAEQDAFAESLLRLIREDPDPAGIPTQYREGIELGRPKVSPDATPEELEVLRQLGYVE